MIYIIATVLSSTSIFVVFRLAKNYSCNLLHLITLNYLVATFFGFSVLLNFDFSILFNSKPWLFTGIILGTLFIAMFFLIGQSSQKAGITITTMANKVSLIFPVLFSMLWFHEKLTVTKYFAFFLAFLAIYLSLYKKDIKKTNPLFIFLPVIIFLGSGITDSLIKFVQAVKISAEETAHFSAFVFLTACILALLISIFNRRTFNQKVYPPTLILGLVLGLVNFGSLYFLIYALNKSNMSSSVVFAAINISIVILSAIIGITFFREKLSKLNIVGVFVAILSLYLLL